mmetsp:Transcript_14494/g.33544  ORF Transcript_14494/g.33544 Transcript_14494/m.33544 type:complete len:280 (+) Transcript_14494:126-965(+)
MIDANKITSPKCVNETNPYLERRYGRTHITSARDINNMNASRRTLDSRWSRERVFAPRSDTFDQVSDYDDNEYSMSLLSPNNDIRINSGTASQSMMLFSDNLVSQEIQSVIGNANEDCNDQKGCPLRYRFSSEKKLLESSENFHTSEGISGRSSHPQGVVVVVDGSPFFPSYSTMEDEISDIDIDIDIDIFKNNEEEDHHDDLTLSTTIRRTFAFDDQLPMIHSCLQRASFCMTASTEEDEYEEYYYSQEPLSFTIPITTSNEHGNPRRNLLYHVSPST